MHADQNEMKQFDSGWIVVLLIWGAILASLGVYLVICSIVGRNLQINLDSDFPLGTLKYALFVVSFITLLAVYYLRKLLLRPTNAISSSTQTSPDRNPALAKYTVAIIITSALLESIAIYGVVLFFLAKDTSSLYQLLFISAAAMLFFRPRKSELLNLAAQMKKQHNL